jgi:hypothetical protein
MRKEFWWGNPEGKIPLGIRKLRWESNIGIDLK